MANRRNEILFQLGEDCKKHLEERTKRLEGSPLQAYVSVDMNMWWACQYLMERLADLIESMELKELVDGKKINSPPLLT